MEVYIDQIEKYLRGQMNRQEENAFKELLASNKPLRSTAFLVVIMLKHQKAW